MEIDYKAVIEIIESFLQNEKIQITGISCGKEYEFRTAIENLLKAYKEDEAVIEEQNRMIDLIVDKFKEGTEYYYSEFDYMSKEEIKEYFINKL